MRLFLQAGKFFERAPDEMPYPCYWDRRRRRTTKRSTRACACSGACSSPVIVLLPRLLSAFSFSRNADFMGVSGREAIKFPVLYRDSKAKNARDANGGCTFAKLESRKRASTCSHSTPKRTRGFIRYGGCKATTTQPKSAFCQNEANG